MRNEVPISVVIPYFDESEVIGRAVQSAVDQTSQPQEIIIVNDGCVGKKRERLENALSKINFPNLRIIHLEVNSGSSFARNRGWQEAIGEFVAFLDADDVWHPEKLQIQYEFMANNPDIDLTGHRHAIVLNDDTWKSPSIKDPGGVSPVTLWNLLLVNQFVTPSVMIRTSYPLRFNSQQRYMEDYDLWLTMAANGAKMVRLELDLTALFKAPFGKSGLSSHLIQMEKGELLTYWSLCKKKPALILILPLLLAYSLIKFVRRLFVTYFQNSSFIKVK